MKFSFEGKVVLTLEHKKGWDSPTHVATNFNLYIDEKLDRDLYFDEEGYPNRDGLDVLSNVLVQGVLGNIHAAHQNGLRDSAEHLRWVISELERGFVAQVNVIKSRFEDHE